MRKRILLVCDVKGWGGWERAENIKRYLSDEFDFDMMDSSEFKKWEEESDSSFISVEEINFILNRTQARFTKRMIPLPELLNFKKNKRTKDRPYDLYYLMFHTMLCAQDIKRVRYAGGKMFSVVTGAPVVKEVFDNERYARNRHMAFKTLANESVGMGANNILSLNELAGLYDGPKYYIPRGVDPDLWGNNPDSWDNLYRDDGPKNFTALFCGKKDSGKGLKSVILPACQSDNLGPEKVNLLINQRNYTNALTKPEMKNWYNQGHVYLVASETDGTPNPALEAAACGRPIISNYIGNMPEFIKDGWNGFLVGREPKQYRLKLKYLKENPDKCREMGENARKTVLENWTWEHSMEHERKALRDIFK